MDAKERRAQHEARELAERHGAPMPPAGPPPARPAASRIRTGMIRSLRRAALLLLALYVTGFGLTVGWLSSVAKAAPFPNAPAGPLEATRKAKEALRAYRLPPDPSITPEEAGRALASLAAPEAASPRGFTRKVIENHPSAPWRVIPLSRDLFGRDLQPNSWGLPRHADVIRRARGGMTGEQRRALRLVGTAEVWTAFDRVGRASAIDILGAHFELPFGAEARIYAVPAAGLSGLRDLGTASLTRAAWHLAEGRKDSAEAALLTMISAGSLIEEQSLQSVDLNAGRRMRFEGWNALLALYEAANDPRAAELKRVLSADSVSSTIERGRGNATRTELIAGMRSPELPPATRVAHMRFLLLTSCTSATEIVFGPSDEVKQAMAELRRELGRYPSEQAFLELASKPLEPNDFFEIRLTRRMLGSGILGGALGNIYFNPRFRSCAMLGALRR